ncbi:hypothetical protein [Streptomyces mesophilus]|uniref:hypothetical protein n=1 Tax=Streptomyces mesophilus TaxID=1775132 RepID=UPI0033284B9E
MSREQRPNPRLNEDLLFQEKPGGPPLYNPNTDKPVRYLTIVDGGGRVLGYAWANDADDAGGYTARAAAGDDGHNKGGRWARKLREAKAAGLPPTEALRQLIAFGGDELSRVEPAVPAELPSLAALKELAASS